MKCEYCSYNLGEVCQASLPDSQLFGCDPFKHEEEKRCIGADCPYYSKCMQGQGVPMDCPVEE